MVAILPARPVSIEVAAALVRLSDLLSLEPGWDGESALPPSPAAMRAAMRFLLEHLPDGPAPAIGPGFDGTVEMEWHIPGKPFVSVSFDESDEAFFGSFTRERVIREETSPDLAVIADAVVDALG